MKTVDIVDYGVGNIGSVMNMVKKVGGSARVITAPEKLTQAEKLILPGVGAFDHGMQTLIDGGWVDALNDVAQNRRIPILGICLGMQMLMSESEEHGFHQGLGIVPGKVLEIPRDDLDGVRVRKIPHIGWSALRRPSSRSDWDNTILQDTAEGEYFYFVHSFMSVPDNTDDVLAECEYDNLAIAACVARDNILGCQFHPEKSGRSGLKILDRFLKT